MTRLSDWLNEQKETPGHKSVITVRLPKDIHRRLKQFAAKLESEGQANASMNMVATGILVTSLDELGAAPAADEQPPQPTL